MAVVRCPRCGDELDVRDEHREWTVRCPHCAAEFVPSDADAPRAPRRAEPRYDRRPRRREPDDYDDEDDYDRFEHARQTVAAPAQWLEVIGWLGAAGAAGLVAVCVAGAVVFGVNGPAVPLLLIGGCAGVLGVPYSALLAIGARRMRELSSHGWALTACLLAVSAFSVWGVIGVIHAGFGVWGLIALDKPEVRAAFGLPPRRR